MNVIRFRPTVRGRRFGRILALAIVALLLGHAAPVAASTFEDGLAAYHRGDYAEALQLWRSLAEQGNSAAQTALGRMYDEGVGVPQDYVEAARFYRMAAERGDSFGQNNLGVMYMKGEGVPQDYIQAMKWTRKAVAQGNELARWNLDLLLADNAGLQQASPEVMKSYRNAADGKGRPKGARNTMTKNLREMILGALDDAGGQAFLAEQAQTNPAAFMGLLGRVLPPEPRNPLPPHITFKIGDRDLRPPKDVTPATESRPLPSARLPALCHEQD
jgi:TPR repeat protein